MEELVSDPPAMKNAGKILSAILLLTFLHPANAQCPAIAHPAPSTLDTPALRHTIVNVAGLNFDQTLSFLYRFQDAVRCNDKIAISNQVHYPLLINLGQKKLHIKSRAGFLKIYPTIFDENLKKAVLSQIPDTLIANQYGVALQHGEVWFGQTISKQGKESPIQIMTINNDWLRE